MATRCNCHGFQTLQAFCTEFRLSARHSCFVRLARGLTAAFLGIASMGSAQSLPDLYRITDGVSHHHVEYHQMSLAKGKEAALADLKGAGKITYFYITDDTQVHWYPGLVLKVFWDGESEPSIQTPLADFFGAVGGKTIDYASAPMQINHGCYMCYLPMPFSQRARFVLANDGDQDYSHSVAYGLDYELDPAYTQEKSRLHCAWHRSNPVQDGATPLDQVVKPSRGWRKEHVQFPTHYPSGKRPGSLCGQFPSGVYPESELVGRRGDLFPPGRPNHGSFARNRGRVWLLLGIWRHFLLPILRISGKRKRQQPHVPLVSGQSCALSGIAESGDPEYIHAAQCSFPSRDG